MAGVPQVLTAQFTFESPSFSMHAGSSAWADRALSILDLLGARTIRGGGQRCYPREVATFLTI